MDLKDIRKKIDGIDEQLLPLLKQRMELAADVAEYKKANSIPVLNQAREDEILERIGGKAGEYSDALKIIYASMFDVSRAEQHRIMGAGKELRREVEGALNSKAERNDGAAIGCQGVTGAYSGIAAKKIFPNCKTRFYESFEEVFDAVENGECRYGVIPIENSSSGSVHEVYDLVLQHKFYIAEVVNLQISHCLLAKKGAKKDELKTVCSKMQALEQCKRYIKDNKLNIKEEVNTAIASQKVSVSDDKTLCAIGSPLCAESYNLQIVEKDIQDSEKNSTRFIVISKNLEILPDANKISFIFSIPHSAGSLYRILARFAMFGLNLTKIESRPIPEGNFEYYFYLDFSGNLENEKTLDLMCALSDELPYFSFLGNYRETDIN